MPSSRTLAESGLPCVGFDVHLTGPRATYVSSDNRTGAADAVRHLHSLGHRSIATITGPLHMLPAQQRLAGYLDAVHGLGLKPLHVAGDFFLEGGYTCGAQLAALPADRRPTALFVAGDEMAPGAIHALQDAGLSVPRDVAVVGFDDIEMSALVRPALSTLAQDSTGLGAHAVDTLLRLAREELQPGDLEPFLSPTRLIVRQSCGGSPAPTPTH